MAVSESKFQLGKQTSRQIPRKRYYSEYCIIIYRSFIEESEEWGTVLRGIEDASLYKSPKVTPTDGRGLNMRIRNLTIKEKYHKSTSKNTNVSNM